MTLKATEIKSRKSRQECTVCLCYSENQEALAARVRRHTTVSEMLKLAREYPQDVSRVIERLEFAVYDSYAVSGRGKSTSPGYLRADFMAAFNRAWITRP